jgi:hypothetical protein
VACEIVGIGLQELQHRALKSSKGHKVNKTKRELVVSQTQRCNCFLDHLVVELLYVQLRL